MRVIVQHPETVGHGPQLFQTFTVHRSPVTKVMLSEKHLVSGNNHKELSTVHLNIDLDISMKALSVTYRQTLSVIYVNMYML